MPPIPDHPYRILIIEGSGSGKTNSLFDLISHEPDFDKIYLYAKDSYKTKYQLLINKKDKADLKHINGSKALLNTRIIWTIFIRILKNTIQTRIAKY